MNKQQNKILINVKFLSLVCLLISLFPCFVSCEKKIDIDSIIARGKMNAVTIMESTQNGIAREIDFNEYSSQGGIIEVYIEKNDRKWFSATLYGEVGKVLYEFYPFDTNFYIVKTTYTYDKSIYDGDVKIISEDKEIIAIINETQYLVTDKVSKSSDQSIKLMVDDILKVIDE